jgi:hypothetical protein
MRVWNTRRLPDQVILTENPPVGAVTGASLGSSGWRRVQGFSSIRPFLRGISHLGDGASSLLAERPRAKT